MLHARLPNTGNLFVAINKIEVLTTRPRNGMFRLSAQRHSAARHHGALSNANNDDDKIYYTTDGSTPTMDSPMYNRIAAGGAPGQMFWAPSTVP